MPYRQKRSRRDALRIGAAGIGAAAFLGAAQTGSSADPPADPGNTQRLNVAAPGTAAQAQAPVKGQAQAPVRGQAQAPVGQQQQAPTRMQMQQAPAAAATVRARGLPQAGAGSQPVSKEQAPQNAPPKAPH